MEGSESDESNTSEQSYFSDSADDSSQAIPLSELKDLCDEIGVEIPGNYIHNIKNAASMQKKGNRVDTNKGPQNSPETETDDLFPVPSLLPSDQRNDVVPSSVPMLLHGQVTEISNASPQLSLPVDKVATAPITMPYQTSHWEKVQDYSEHSIPALPFLHESGNYSVDHHVPNTLMRQIPHVDMNAIEPGAREYQSLQLTSAPVQIKDYIDLVDKNKEKTGENNVAPSPSLMVAVTFGERNTTKATPEVDNNAVTHVDMNQDHALSLSEYHKALCTDDTILESNDVPLEPQPPQITRGKVCTPTTREKRQRLWKRISNKSKRMRGEAYMGFKTYTDPVTEKKRTFQIIPRDQRVMGPPCKSIYCKTRKTRQCSNFSETQRSELYTNFWKNMNGGEKKAHVRSLVDQIEPKPSKEETSRRRGKSFVYYLKLDGRRTRVCQSMFLSTLGLRKKQTIGWLNYETPDSPKKASTHVNSNGGDRSYYKDFLAAIEKMPSHYCRQRTSKQYLEILFRTKQEVYNAYKSECLWKGIVPASSSTFSMYFRENNYDIHQPKKDMCDACSAYREGNVTKEEYNKHQEKKESARAEKTRDKESAAEGKLHVVTMDVQKVLLSPMLNASALYYKTKLTVHNFTVYDLITHNATCYLFDETEADLSSSSFATCLVSFFETHYKDDLPIILYSDGCTSQNRNGFLSSALLHYSTRFNKIVTQKYLEKGHTQMECDSVHAIIEKKLRGKQIYVPYDYIKTCVDARSLPQPYKVVYMHHKDFQDYSTVKLNIRPGSKKGDHVVTDLRQLKYDPSGEISYKVNHLDSWARMPRSYRVDSNKNFPQLYNQRLPISEKKYKDLQDLLHVIPPCHHDFYKSLPYKKA